MIENNTLIYDLETKTFGKPDSSKDIMRVFGCYSYKTKKYYMLTDNKQIQKIIDAHKYLVGFNNEGTKFEPGYDNPILRREGINIKYKIFIDLRKILKGRASQMMIKKGMLGDLIMEYSLDFITKLLDLVDEKTGKGELDYDILKKDVWTKEEHALIYKYTKRDIEITKKLYEWIENYFDGFKHFLTEEDIKKKVYINSSIAKFAYKAICNAMKWQENYGDITGNDEKIGGGYVAYPAGEKFEGNIYCLDFNSLYPHIMILCNLYGRKKMGTLDDRPIWTGNNTWKVNGIYYADKMNDVCKLLYNWYLDRVKFKKEGNNKQYTIKIILNAIYGILNNAYYNRVYDRVAGGDCTRIGRQWTKYARKVFKENGYDVIYTDSVGKDSQIRTTKGNFTIEELFNKGKKVFYDNKEKVILNNYYTLSINDDKEIIYDKIKSIIRHKTKKKKYKIKLNCYENLIVTENHSLIWFDDYGNFIEKKPKDSKNVIVLSKIPFVGDFDKSLSKEFLMFLGFMIGDGSVPNIKNKTNDKYYFGVSTGLDTKEFIKKIIKPIGLKYYIQKNSYDIIFYDKKIKKWLRENGFAGTSKTKKIPSFIFNLDNKQIGWFLCGYFSADGSANQGKPGIGSVNEKLMIQIKELLLRLEITSTMKRDFKKNHFNGVESDTYNYWLIVRDCKKFYEKVGFIFDRKNDKVLKKDNHMYFATLAERTKIRNKNNKNYKGELLYQKSTINYIDLPVRHIQKIEKIKYDDYVYDIETETTSKFFANDILVHNTDSVYIIDKFNDKERMLSIKNKIIEFIKSTVSFPKETFDMGIDDEIKYMFFFKGKNNDEKDTDKEMDSDDFINKPKGFMKKNYIYVAKIFDKDGNYTGKDKVVVKNLGIKKKSNSALSKKIFWDYLVPQIKKGEILFSKVYIQNLITELLQKDLSLAMMRKSVGPFEQYQKSPTCLSGQIAKRYGQGIHFLIPNDKGIGVGKGKSFCTLKEFKKYNMKINNIDLNNVWQELNYFIRPVVEKNIFDF